MATIHDSYIGFADEATWGTAVAPTRFFELSTESLSGVYERITAEGIRAGQRVARSDRFVVNPKGAEGNVKFEVLDRSFAFFLKHMLGTVTTTGASAPFTHTGTSGGLLGKGLTVQVGRVANDGTLHPFTYTGCKVKDWELSCGIDGILMLDLGLDSNKENVGAGAGPLAQATPTYPTGAQLYTFNSGTITVGGSTFQVGDFSVKQDNSLNTDRYLLGTSNKRQPVEEGMRSVEFELKAEFDSLAQYNRVAAATAAGALANIQVAFTSPQGSTLTVTLPQARFDEGQVNFDGAKVMEQNLKGMALTDGTASEITIAMTSTEPTP